MRSEAKSVSSYLGELEPKRSSEIKALVDLVRKNIKPGFDETMRWGMISYEVPYEISGETYNGQPLSFIGIASQKNHISIYLMGLYAQPDALERFQELWARSGKKLDMGKGCVRFKTLKDADLDALSWAISRFELTEFLTITKK